ncbi:MAG: hypothetical protein R3Y24_11350 [Eubacteriales bacterium]
MTGTILFLISFLLVYSGMLFFPKSNKSLDVIKCIFVVYIYHMCIRTVLVGIMNNLFGIPVKQSNIMILYLLCGLLLWGYILKKKSIQKMHFERHTVFIVGVLTIAFAALSIWIFSYNMRLVYTTGDPANHFKLAMDVVNSNKVSGMYFNHLQNAIFIELFQPFLAYLKLYKAFLFANIVINYILLIFFYIVISEFVISRLMKIIAPIICILFYAGYPLNLFVRWGFAYFTTGVLLVAFTVYTLQLYVKETDKNTRAILMVGLILGCINTALCYMILAPATYLGVFIVLLAIWKRDHAKNELYKPMIKIAGIVIFVFAILLMVMIQYFGGSIEYLLKALGTGGTTYMEFFADFVFLMPAVLYFCISSRFKERIQVPFLFFVGYFTCAVVEFLLVYYTDILSTYYFTKVYFPLWMLVFIILVQVIQESRGEARKLILAYNGIFLVVAVISLLQIDVKVSARMGWNTTASIPIYQVNMGYLYQDFEELKFSEDILALYEYVLEQDKEVTFVGSDSGSKSLTAGNWYAAMTGEEKDYYSRAEHSLEMNLEDLEEKGVEYGLVLFLEGGYYDRYKDYFDSLERIYENNAGCLVKLEY